MVVNFKAPVQFEYKLYTIMLNIRIIPYDNTQMTRIFVVVNTLDPAKDMIYRQFILYTTNALSF